MGKIIKSIILSALFMALAGTGTVQAEETMPDLSMGSVLTDELSMDAEPQMAGRVESTGIYFEVKDSEWLNVYVASSELIKLALESVPNMITMHIEAAAGATTTQITIKGLAPQTTYHKYEDNYHNHEAFTTDDNGSYTYAQDLSVPHMVFIQTKKSTKFIKDDATGGDCYSIGIWDSPTKTCILTMDLNETIQIDSDGITLDGNGHTLTGNNTGRGIFLSGRTGVSIKNININNFSEGISLLSASNNVITRVNATSNFYGIYLAFYGSTGVSNNNLLADNNTLNNIYGIYLVAASGNTLKNNTALNNEFGISIFNGWDSGGHTYAGSKNTLIGNIMTGNKYNFNLLSYWAAGIEVDNDIDISNLVDGKPIYYIKNASNQVFDASTNAGTFYCINCNNVIIDGLELTKNETGIYLHNTQNSTIRNITASNNKHGIFLLSSSNNTLTDNNTSNSGYGIYLESSSNNNTLAGNLASNNNYYGYGAGISIRNSNSNTLTGNTVSKNSAGISLSRSNSNIVAENTASGNYGGVSGMGGGINISFNCSDNVISNNNLFNNSYGIFSWNYGSNNVFSGNTTSNNRSGIYIIDSKNTILIDNIVHSNVSSGIFLHTLGPTTLKGNKMWGNKYNFATRTRSVGVDSDIDTSNTVDGKPIYFIKNASNQTFDASTNAGVFYCLYCSNVIIESLTLTNNQYGVYLYNTNNSTIRNITASKNATGVSLYASGNNTIYNNTFSGNGTGLDLYYSSNNTIYNNNFANNYSNLTNPDYYWSYGWRQAVLSSNSTGNIFTLPAPIGGNYWNNYDTATKGCSDLDGDGFCDAPYLFSGGQDNLPWTKQDGWKNSSSDSTPPTTTASLSGTSGSNGWYLSDVQVSLMAADNDGGSGVAKTEYSFDGANWTAYSTQLTVNAEGSTTVYYKSTDIAGNAEAVKSLTVSIDKTPPSITGTATTSPNANGWYNTDVVVHFTASDNVSGIDTVTPDIAISSEGTNQSATGTAFDKAGNSASATVTGINIDKTAPVITITSPAATQYDHSAAINISFTATDDVSGIYKTTAYLDDQQYDPANPISLLYLPLGIHTLKVESENYAGLIAAQSVDFEIIATASGTTSAITTLYQTGAIDSAGIANSLTQKLEAVQAAISSNQTVSAQNILEAFINMLDAQSGKHISTSAAEILKADALYMISQL